MSRSHKSRSVIIGNYVNFMMVAKGALIANDTDIIVDRLTLKQPFRISQVCFYQQGATGTPDAKIINQGTLAASVANLAADTPTIITPGNMATQPIRDVVRGGQLRFDMSTGAAETTVIGGTLAWIHGYFTEHIALAARFAEAGQGSLGGPAAGYYDILPFYNTLVNNADGIRNECRITAPYACRLMSLSYNVLGHVETTGAIVANFQNNGTDVHTDLDVDLNENFIVDAASSPAFTSSALRDVVKGNPLALRLGTGASDTVDPGELTCHALVWVKGHIRDENAEPLIED